MMSPRGTLGGTLGQGGFNMMGGGGYSMMGGGYNMMGGGMLDRGSVIASGMNAAETQFGPGWRVVEFQQQSGLANSGMAGMAAQSYVPMGHQVQSCMPMGHQWTGAMRTVPVSMPMQVMEVPMVEAMPVMAMQHMQTVQMPMAMQHVQTVQAPMVMQHMQTVQAPVMTRTVATPETEVFIEVLPQLEPNFARGPNGTFIMELSHIVVQLATTCNPPLPQNSGMHKPYEEFVIQFPEMTQVVFDPHTQTPPNALAQAMTVKRGTVLKVPREIGVNTQLKTNSPYGSLVLEDVQIINGVNQTKVGENALHYRLQVDGHLEAHDDGGIQCVEVDLQFTFTAQMQMDSWQVNQSEVFQVVAAPVI